MKIEDLKILNWPPLVDGVVSKGVKVIHVPTGKEVICTEHRAQYKNKEQALAELEALVHGY